MALTSTALAQLLRPFVRGGAVQVVEAGAALGPVHEVPTVKTMRQALAELNYDNFGLFYDNRVEQLVHDVQALRTAWLKAAAGAEAGAEDDSSSELSPSSGAESSVLSPSSTPELAKQAATLARGKGKSKAKGKAKAKAPGRARSAANARRTRNPTLKAYHDFLRDHRGDFPDLPNAEVT